VVDHNADIHTRLKNANPKILKTANSNEFFDAVETTTGNSDGLGVKAKFLGEKANFKDFLESLYSGNFDYEGGHMYDSEHEKDAPDELTEMECLSRVTEGSDADYLCGLLVLGKMRVKNAICHKAVMDMCDYWKTVAVDEPTLGAQIRERIN